MLPAITAEFRKLFTVRSTYIVSVLAILLSGFFSFYIQGMRAEGSLMFTGKLQDEIISTVALLAIFGAIIATLLITHEYRYNTIMYTLTASNSRSKVIIAKITAVMGYVLLFALTGVIVSVAAMYLGLAVKDYSLISQTIHWGDLLWRCFYYMLAYGLAGLVLGFLARQVVGAIVIIFLFPSTIEPLLGLLLKENAKYLPFTALNRVVDNSPAQSGDALTVGVAAAVFGGYLAVAWIVAWVLFYRRDAN